MPRYHGRSQPGTYFKSGGSTGGCGSGAAFGAKLAKPQSDVVLATGDGYFMFGTPLVALWCAAHYKAPFLSVVFVNRSYSTGTTSLQRHYPRGAAVRAGDYEGGLFDPPPDFAKLAEAANGYGESVQEPEEVGPALRRGLEQVRQGSPAVIAVMLPTLVEEMGQV
jgi:acetolactate synthase-1/2/3 large subunit